MGHPAPIFLLTGPPGAGKTTVAAHLLQHFSFGLHVPVDDLREWVVAGMAHPLPTWTDETTRQFRLARQSAAHIGQRYNEAGFAVVIDDLVFAAEAQTVYAEPLASRALHKIVLLPAVEVALVRNAARRTKHFDTAALAEPIRALHRALAAEPFAALGWRVLDTSTLTVEQAVNAIMRDVV